MLCIELPAEDAPLHRSAEDAPAGDPRLVITRSFLAPRELVWRCYTDPVHLVRFWGPHGATNPVCEIDLRVGGAWRQVMRFPSGTEYGYTSAYLEIARPERLVWRDAPEGYRFGDPLPPPEMVTTLTLSEVGRFTTVAARVECLSVAGRDEAIRNGFATVVTEAGDKFDVYLETLAAAAASSPE